MNPWPVAEEVARGAPAAPRPRRPGGHPEVQAERRAQHPRARLRARDGRARGRRRAVQGVPAGARRERLLARDPDRLGARARAPSARSRRRTSPTSTSRRCAAWTRRPRARWSREIDRLRKANESLGGVFEVQAFGLVPGLGSHVSWEERLDGRLAMAICSIQAIKGVSLGDGFAVAGLPGSQAHDEIFFSERARLLPRDEPRRRARGRHDERLAAVRARRDEAAADADQAAALGRHRRRTSPRRRCASAPTPAPCPPRASSARRWLRSCSPTHTGRSSVAITSTTCSRPCAPTSSASDGTRPDRLHGRRQVDRRGASSRPRSACEALDSDVLLEEQLGHSVAEEFERSGEAGVPRAARSSSCASCSSGRALTRCSRSAAVACSQSGCAARSRAM